MKEAIASLFMLISITLNAQNMKNAQETVISLFVATDQRNWDALEKIFADEVTLDYQSFTGNPAVKLSAQEIISSWKGILPGFENTHHQIGNVLYEVKDDKVQVSCYGTATHYLTDTNGNLWTVVGTYDFILEKEKGSWQVTHMKFNFKYQDGNTSLPEKAINILKN